jgi:NAD(P)-dependent dehydrogenase (short-subunit alcohol dehydrogenase family)
LDLKGKVVIITGGSSGIGKAVAKVCKGGQEGRREEGRRKGGRNKSRKKGRKRREKLPIEAGAETKTNN